MEKIACTKQDKIIKLLNKSIFFLLIRIKLISKKIKEVMPISYCVRNLILFVLK